MLVVVLGFFVAVAAYWVVWLCVFWFMDFLNVDEKFHLSQDLM